MTWQSIETAPKTGTRILATDSQRGYVGIVSANDGAEWELVNERRTPLGIGFYPDYWMPLPEPPK